MGNNKETFDQALKYANNKAKREFEELMKESEKQAFIALKKPKEKDTNELINIVSPWFLVAFAGCLSRNEEFNHQEKILSDLFPVEEDTIAHNRLFPSRKSLAYVYHHVYGALNIKIGNLDKLDAILEQKIPQNRMEGMNYVKLRETECARGHQIELFGKDNNFVESFKILFNAYSRWQCLNLLFENEGDYKKFLVCYQLAIYILDYFDKLKIQPEFFIPPAFLTADSQSLKAAYHLLIKHDNFFKAYVHKNDIKDQAIKKWQKWLETKERIYFPPNGIPSPIKNDTFDLMKNLLD